MPEEAHKLLTPLVGIYELRLGDAHLPSSTIDEALVMAKVDKTARPIQQGLQLLVALADALASIGDVVKPAVTTDSGPSSRKE